MAQGGLEPPTSALAERFLSSEVLGHERVPGELNPLVTRIGSPRTHLGIGTRNSTEALTTPGQGYVSGPLRVHHPTIVADLYT